VATIIEKIALCGKEIVFNKDNVYIVKNKVYGYDLVIEKGNDIVSSNSMYTEVYNKKEYTACKRMDSDEYDIYTIYGHVFTRLKYFVIRDASMFIGLDTCCEELDKYETKRIKMVSKSDIEKLREHFEKEIGIGKI